MKSNLYLILFLTAISPSIEAQNYVIDSLYAENGVFQTNISGIHYNTEITMLENNEIFVSGKDHSIWGWFGSVGENSLISQYKINSCGKLDSTFGENGKLGGEIQEVFPEKFIFENDQSAYVIGYKNEGQWYYPYLSKITPNGQLDSNFQIQPISTYTSFLNVYNGRFIDLVKDSINQNILCIGSYKRGNEMGAMLMSFNEDGSIDSSVYNNGRVEIPIINETSHAHKTLFSKSINVDENRFLLCGTNASKDSLILAMITKNGVLDADFGIQGVMIDSSVSITSALSNIDLFAETVLNNNFISTKEFIDNQTLFKIKKYNNDGLLDPNFGINGVIQITPDSGSYFNFRMKKVLNDKILISYLGQVYNPDGSNEEQGDFIILNDNGTFNNDYTFQLINQEYNQSNLLITDLRLGNDNKMYITGTNSSNKLVLIRFTENSLVPHLSINGNYVESNISNPNANFSWSVNGNVLSNEIESNIEITTVGEYVLTVSDPNGCGSASDTLIIESVNLYRYNLNNVVIYPNPTTEQIFIHSESKLGTLSLLDISGRIIFQKSNLNTSFTYNLSHLSSGTYYIKTDNYNSILIKQ